MSLVASRLECLPFPHGLCIETTPLDTIPDRPYGEPPVRRLWMTHGSRGRKDDPFRISLRSTPASARECLRVDHRLRLAALVFRAGFGAAGHARAYARRPAWNCGGFRRHG